MQPSMQAAGVCSASHGDRAVNYCGGWRSRPLQAAFRGFAVLCATFACKFYFFSRNSLKCFATASAIDCSFLAPPLCLLTEYAHRTFVELVSISCTETFPLSSMPTHDANKQRAIFPPVDSFWISTGAAFRRYVALVSSVTTSAGTPFLPKAAAS